MPKGITKSLCRLIVCVWFGFSPLLLSFVFALILHPCVLLLLFFAFVRLLIFVIDRRSHRFWLNSIESRLIVLWMLYYGARASRTFSVNVVTWAVFDFVVVVVCIKHQRQTAINRIPLFGNVRKCIWLSLYTFCYSSKSIVAGMNPEYTNIAWNVLQILIQWDVADGAESKWNACTIENVCDLI